MSEKSTRKAPDYEFEFRAVRNRSVFRPDMQRRVAILLKSGIICANQGRKRRFQIQHVAVYVVFPSVLFFILSHLVFIDRYFIVDADLCLLGAVALFLPRWLRAILAALLMAMGFNYIAARWYFFDPDEFVRTASFLMLLRLSHLTLTVVAEFACAVIVVVLYGWLAGRCSRTRPLTAAILCLASFAVLESIDVYNDNSTIIHLHTGPVLFTQKLLGSFLTRSVGYFRPSYYKDTAHAIDHAPRLRSASLMLTSPGLGRATNTVLIVVESWGQLRDAAAEATVIAPLTALGDRYEITTGLVPFAGGTTRGELRELCNLDLDYRLIEPDSKLDCLPKRFASHGYSITAIHGFSAMMFYRYQWWPRVGLTNTIFGQDLFRMGYHSSCGSVFNGICDSNITAFIGDRLSQKGSGHQFIYWMTINTHLPVPVDMAAHAPFPCQLIAHGTMEACMQAGLLRQLFSEIASMIHRSDIPPTEFLLVGDHAPPFGSSQSRDTFIAQQVPYILLTPR